MKNKFLLLLLLPFLFSCGKEEKNYENVVVEKAAKKKVKIQNSLISYGEYELTGPISIQIDKGSVAINKSGISGKFSIAVSEESKGDSLLFPLVRHGKNQSFITTAPKKDPFTPIDWIITLPDSFEVRIQGGELSGQVNGVTGILTIINQKGDLNLKEFSGALEINNQEGNIEMEDLILLGRSLVTTQWGRVKATMGGDLLYEISLSSGAEDVDFSLNGFDVSGRVEVITKVGSKGLEAYRSPDSVGSFISSGLEVEYQLEAFDFGAELPVIRLSSGDGRVIFSKN